MGSFFFGGVYMHNFTPAHSVGLSMICVFIETQISNVFGGVYVHNFTPAHSVGLSMICLFIETQISNVN